MNLNANTPIVDETGRPTSYFLSWAASGEATGSKTYDPGSVADKASLSTTVPASGAQMGMRAEATFSRTLAGMSLTAEVSMTGVITATFSNLTGGAVDLAPGTLKVWAR